MIQCDAWRLICGTSRRFASEPTMAVSPMTSQSSARSGASFKKRRLSGRTFPSADLCPARAGGAGGGSSSSAAAVSRVASEILLEVSTVTWACAPSCMFDLESDAAYDGGGGGGGGGGGPLPSSTAVVSGNVKRAVGEETGGTEPSPKLTVDDDRWLSMNTMACSNASTFISTHFSKSSPSTFI